MARQVCPVSEHCCFLYRWLRRTKACISVAVEVREGCRKHWSELAPPTAARICPAAAAQAQAACAGSVQAGVAAGAEPPPAPPVPGAVLRNSTRRTPRGGTAASMADQREQGPQVGEGQKGRGLWLPAMREQRLKICLW